MTDFAYPANLPTQPITPIITRARSIHRVNSAKITRIADLTLATIPAADNDEWMCVNAAATEYNHDCPLRCTTIIPGGQGIYEFDLPTVVPGWDNRFSVDKIYYPINLPEKYLMYDNFWEQTINGTTNNPVLRFQPSMLTPSSYSAQYPSGSFEMWFQAPQMFDATTNLTTIPSWHTEGLAQLIACYMLELTVSIASQFGDQQIFENKDMKELAARLQARANTCKERYKEIVEKDMVDAGPYWCRFELSSPTGYRPFHPPHLY